MTTLTERGTLELYEKTGALMRGHFRLTSGLHSDIYLQSALVLQYPEHAARLGDALAAPFVDAGAQTVLAPAIGGILVAHEAQMRDRLVVLSAIDSERRREQPLVNGLRRFLAPRGLPPADIQVLPYALVQLFLFRILSQD